MLDGPTLPFQSDFAGAATSSNFNDTLRKSIEIGVNVVNFMPQQELRGETDHDEDVHTQLLFTQGGQVFWDGQPFWDVLAPCLWPG